MIKICKTLSNKVYNDTLPKEIDGWILFEKNTIKNMELKSEGKVIKRLNMAYAIYKKDNEVILVFRGTDDVLDYVTDANFVIKRKPPSMKKAISIYQKIRNKNKSAKIYITGHSLGGAYAQVVTGKAIEQGDENCYSITFNAPGLGYYFKNKIKEKFKDKFLQNINNYIVMNDFIGNFREHLGSSYYIQPYPLNIPICEGEDKCFTPHNCIISSCDECLNDYISCPEGWNSKLAWSIFVFDEVEVDGFIGIFKKALDIKVNRHHLKNAVDLIKELQAGNKIKLANSFKFKAGKVRLELTADI